MLLPEALRLQDPSGKDIKWEKNEDGTIYTAPVYEEKPTEDSSGKKLPGQRQIYRIDVLPQIANVSVVQQTIEPEGTKKKTGEDARPKTVEEATASLATGEGSKADVGKTVAADEDKNNKSYHKAK